MRINKFVAQATGMGRRPADAMIAAGKILVNGKPALPGQDILEHDIVTLDGNVLTANAIPSSAQYTTIMLHKPIGYVVSRIGQGSKTIYDLLPADYQKLKPIGRLDKDSSGLLLLTNNGQLAHDLTHPSKRKNKVYQVTLDRPLSPLHRQMISDFGIQLEDGPSKLSLERQGNNDEKRWVVTMQEGRNRQIRRTFAALGYTVVNLHRTQFGPYALNNLALGAHQVV